LGFANKEPRQDIWPPERIDLLKKLWSEGKSGRLIAVELGVTRNAVMGKANRLDLPLRGRTLHGLPRRKPISHKRPSRQNGVVRGERKETRAVFKCGDTGAIVFKSVNVACDLADSPADNPGAFMENRGCRWPCSGEGASILFCGGEIAGRSYCARHHQLACRPVPPLALPPRVLR
jgi:GcrA cell cycle regulator